MDEKISVVIPCYNHEKYVLGAIRDTLDQKGVETEVIVINDASTDGSAKVIRLAKKANPEIITHKNKHRLLFWGAFNEGVKLATGDYLTILQADNGMSHNRLEIQLKELLRHKADGCYCGIKEFYPIDNLNPYRCDWKEPYNITPADEVFSKEQRFFAPEGYLHITGPYKTDTCSFLVRRDLFLEKDLWFRPAGQRIRPCEDYDFAARLIHETRNVIGIHAPLTLYRRQTGTSSDFSV